MISKFEILNFHPFATVNIHAVAIILIFLRTVQKDLLLIFPLIQ
jgi:hypothetical protein